MILRRYPTIQLAVFMLQFLCYFENHFSNQPMQFSNVSCHDDETNIS